MKKHRPKQELFKKFGFSQLAISRLMLFSVIQYAVFGGMLNTIMIMIDEPIGRQIGQWLTWLTVIILYAFAYTFENNNRDIKSKYEQQIPVNNIMMISSERVLRCCNGWLETILLFGCIAAPATVHTLEKQGILKLRQIRFAAFGMWYPYLFGGMYLTALSYLLVTRMLSTFRISDQQARILLGNEKYRSYKKKQMKEQRKEDSHNQLINIQLIDRSERNRQKEMKRGNQMEIPLLHERKPTAPQYPTQIPLQRIDDLILATAMARQREEMRKEIPGYKPEEVLNLNIPPKYEEENQWNITENLALNEPPPYPEETSIINNPYAEEILMVHTQDQMENNESSNYKGKNQPDGSIPLILPSNKKHILLLRTNENQMYVNEPYQFFSIKKKYK